MNAKTILLCLVLLVGCGSEEPAKEGGGPGEGEADPAPAPAKAEAGHAAAVDAIGGEDGEAIRAFLAKDATMKRFFHGSYGFGIWPNVGKGGLVIGGGGGSGSRRARRCRTCPTRSRCRSTSACGRSARRSRR